MLGWLNKGPQTLPECPEPKTKEEYTALANKTLNRILSLLDGDDWEEIPVTKHSNAVNDDTRLFSRQSPDPSEGTSHILKTTGTIACSPSALYRAISSGDVKERQNWEKDLLELRTVEEISKDIQVIYTAFRAPSPVASREFVAMKCKTKKDGKIISYGTSINHPACGLHSVYVRAVATSAFIISAVPGDPNRTHCVRFAQVDPKGMIPGFVINLSKQKAAAAFSILRKAIDERRIPVIDSVEEEEEKENIPVAQNSQPATSEQQSVLDVTIKQNEAPLSANGPTRVDTPMRTTSRFDKGEDDDYFEEDFDEEEEEEYWDCSSETPVSRRRRRRRVGSSHLPSHALETALKSLQETADRIERQSQQIVQRLSALEEKVQTTSNRKDHNESLLSITNVSWSSLAFLVAWPAISYVAIDYFSRKNKKP